VQVEKLFWLVIFNVGKILQGAIMVAAATQIKFNGIVGFVRFIFLLRNTTKQLKTADGLIFVEFKRSRTLTAWENHQAMHAFRNNGHHLEAMKITKKIGKVKSTTWETQSEPSWQEAKEKLKDIEY